ncbi:hypothetical protein GCM10028824_29510 [Hymenobacter segetis]
MRDVFIPGKNPSVNPKAANRVQARTCADVSEFNFSARTAGEDWKTSRTLTTGATTLTSSGYATNSSNQTTTLTVVQDQSFGKVLLWDVDYGNNGGTAPTNTNANYNQVTFTLNRATNGFSMTLNDIDKAVGQSNGNGWTDWVQIDGYATATGGSPIALSASDVTLGTNSTNAWNGNNTIIGTNTNTTTDGNVTVLFPSTVTRVVVTYKNAQTTYNNPGEQIMGFAAFNFCSQADVYAQYTAVPNPTTVVAGSSVSYTVKFGNDGDASSAVSRVVTLPAGAVVTNNGGGTVTGNTINFGTVALATGASNSFTYTYTVPPTAGTYTNTATAGTTTEETVAQQANNSVSSTLTVTNADLLTIISGPSTAVVGQTVYYLANTTNNGTAAAAGTVTTITLPNKPATVTTSANGSYDPSTGIVTFTNGSLAVNATVINSVSFVATAATATGKAASTSTTIDNNAADNNGTAANANVTTTTSATGAAGTPAPCATAGKDLSPTISANPNTYYPSTAAQTLGVGATTINVGVARGAATNIAPGDLLLVIQMQGADINTSNDDTYGDGVAGGSGNGSSVSTNFKAGTYEYVTVASTSATVLSTAGGTITLASGLKNSYVNAVATGTTGQRTFQVIRVPQYINLTLGATISPLAWNGATGGIVALDVAAKLDLAGFNINASGLGFRGGAGRQLGGDNTGTTGIDYRSSAAQNTNGTKGEGLAGTPRYVNDPTNGLLDTRAAVTGYPTLLPAGLNDGYPSGDNGRGAPGNAGGGGTDANPLNNDQNSGGGGGANGGRGGRGGNAWSSATAVGGEPGAAFPAATSSRLVMGGGGGAGSTNNGTGTPNNGFASSGAAGGGIVLVRTGTLTGTGSILANGANANNTVGNDGSGGGGAGGSILVTATNNQATSLALSANGGTGGTNDGQGTQNAAALHGPGGGGGGGVILTNGVTATTATTNGAANGTTLPGPVAFGSEAGATGVSSAAISASIANSVAGVNCVTITANNDFNTITANPAAPVTFSVTGNDVASVGTLTGATINLNPNNIAGQSATTFTVAGQGTYTTVGVPAGQVKFTPANTTFTGNVTIPYTVTNTENVTSNQANLTVSVTPVLDLVTAITGPANNSNVTAGAALSYTVTAQNASAVAASNVTQTLQLVPGLTSNGGAVTFTINGTASTVPTYDNATGLVTFTPSPISLAANTTNTYVANFTKAPASGPITATANIGSTAGSNGPELNRTNNFATNTVNITPSYDVSTTITGSVDGAGLAAPVVSGGLVTYLVRTTNAAGSASPAPSVIQTVTFDGNLTLAADGTTTGLYISNGGTAAYNSGTNKTVVTFPTLSTLPIGQTVTNTISFAAPAATYSATANVQANGAVNPGDNNSGDTNTGAASNDRATVSTTVVAGVGTPANVYTTISSNQTVTTAGTAVILTVAAGNRGAGTATAVVQQVQLPAGLTGVTVGNGTYDSATGIVTFTTIASLAPQATNPLPFTIQFTAPASGPVLATATVREANADPVPADNVGEVKVDIITTTDVSTTLAGPATATVGQAVTYAVTTANPGANTAYNVVQTVQLPAGLNANGGVTFAGTTAGTYDNATGVATFTLASPLAAASRQVNTITFNVPASVITDPSASTTGSNQLALLAAVRTSTTETSSTNNSATTVLAVTPAADVTVAVSGPASALPGSPVTFAVTTTNNGPVPVASIVSTLQLPAGLTTSGGTVLVNGNAAGASYDNATGVVTFATATNLPSGGSVANTVTVQMPDVTQLVPVTRAQVGSTTIDTDLSNNRADALTTRATTSVAGSADLATSISISGGVSSVTPGASVTLNATFSNLAGGITATTVVPRVQLPAGLANGSNVVTVAGGTGGVYNNTTGLVTWNSVNSLASGAAALTGYNVTFKAPASGSVTGTSFVSSATADAVASNNANSAVITVTSQVDVTTSVKGPAVALAGSRVTYAVVTTNNGPSPSGVVTQTVTIPATATNISFPAGSTQAPASGGTITITFPLMNAMSVTPAGDVVNYVSFDAPNASYTVSATANTPGDTNTGNNTVATPFATAIDQTPTAYDVVNTLPSFLTGVIGSTAGPIKISPLTGTDADAGQTATLTYTLTSLPAANTGILYLDAARTAPAATGVGYTATQIANLYFDPRGTILATDPTYVGNVTFGYTTTDTPGLTSAPALYTIAIGKDEKSTATSTATKGRTVKYQDNDVIVNLIDVNTVKYNADGSLPFGKYLADRTVNPNPANGGLTSVVQTGGTLAPGLALDAATGQIYVSNRLALKSGTYSITVTTIDANGGTNSLTYSYTIGDFPLPVELTDFTATAVKNLDAALLWHTAQEKNNDHFDVERSLNGTDFVKIGEVKGQGSKTTTTEYALTDAGIGPKAKGLVYYRLKQMDTDGETSYSPVRTVTFTTTLVPAIVLFPNPATTGTQLDLTQLPTGRYQVSVLDATGRIVLNTTLEAGLAHALDLNTIASGTYNLLVRGQANGQTINLTKRLIKE